MNKTDNITKSKSLDKPTKRGKIAYIDFFMAILATIVIIFVFTFINNRSFLLSLIGLFLIAILFTGTIITFLKRNPYYIIFCYGLSLCGILGNIINVIANAYFAIIFIPYFYYVYSIIDYNVFIERPRFFREHSFVESTIDHLYFFKKNQQQKRLEESFRKKVDKIDEKFKFNLILFISIVCSIFIFITLISSALI